MDGILEQKDKKGTLVGEDNELLGYADDEVFAVDNFKDIPHTSIQRIHQIVVVICKSGKLQVVIDGVRRSNVLSIKARTLWIVCFISVRIPLQSFPMKT